MNSTLKSLLFWMVLVVIGILIWEFSTNFQRNDTPVNLTEFLDKVDHNEINHVTFTGNELVGKLDGPQGEPEPGDHRPGRLARTSPTGSCRGEPARA